MPKFKIQGLLPLAAACFMAASAGMFANAQSSTQGAIGGTVYDSTDAIIGKATINIHNNATNAEQNLTADASGFFKAPLLEPGYYTVTVKMSGFTTYKSSNVEVTVGLLTELLPHLTTGSESTVVTVTAEAPILNFDSPDFTSTLNQRALEDIPINLPRWSALALTTPGVVSDSNGFGLVSVRGISPLLNNVLIDGADDNQAFFSEERGRTREAYSTPPEAIREFNVNTGVYSAEFGRAAGAVINSVTKSGGNQIHGMGFFQDRSSNWGTYNDFTTNTTGVQNSNGSYTFTTAPYKPIDSRRIWGFTAGGALIHDKLFWQYTYDQHHRNFPGTAKANVPGTFFLQPDSALASIAGAPTCSLTTGYLSGSATTNTNYSLDAQACTLAARLKLTSYDAGAAAYSSGLASLLPDLGTVPRIGDQEVNMPKLDFQINEKNHVSFIYNRLRWDSPGGVQTQATNQYAIDSFGTDFVKLDYGIAKLNSLITSSISNELLYQYGRELGVEGQQPLSAYSKAHLMGTGTSAGNIPEVALATSTGFYLGSPYYSYRKAYPDERKWQIGDTLYISRGNHSIKVGLDAVHNYDIQNNTYESNGYITYSFLSTFLADIASEGGTPTCNSTTVSAATATVSGVGTFPCYSTFVQGFGAPVFDTHTFDYGLFVQDNWKIAPRLTLQLGARYDQEILPAPYSALTAASGTFVPYAALNNHPSDKNNIGPRIGFSYDPFGKGTTTVRGGYGIMYGRITNGNILNALLTTGSPLGQYTASLKPSASGAPVFPNIISAATPPTPSSFYLASNLQNPQIHEFDIAVQQGIGHGTVMQVSYLGALGRELTNYVNTNLAAPGTPYVSGSTTITPPTNTTVTITDTTGKSPLPAGTTITLPQYTSYVNTAFTSITGVVSNINSSYNALVVELSNKSSKTIQFDVNYTWSHSLDFNQQAGTATTTNNQFAPGGNMRGDYGNSIYNVPNRITGYVLYNLPNRSTKDVLSRVVNDWSLDTAFQGQSGLPYSASIQSGFSSTLTVNSYLNGAGGDTFIPQIGRNTYKLKRVLTQDFRVQKLIPIAGRFSGSARLDLFNLYNHQNYTGVTNGAYILTSTGTGSANAAYQSAFGTYTNSNSNFVYTPRQVQIGFQLLF